MKMNVYFPEKLLKKERSHIVPQHKKNFPKQQVSKQKLKNDLFNRKILLDHKFQEAELVYRIMNCHVSNNICDILILQYLIIILQHIFYVHIRFKEYYNFMVSYYRFKHLTHTHIHTHSSYEIGNFE